MLFTVVFSGDSGKSLLSHASQLTPNRTEIKSEWLFWAREKDFISMGNLCLSNLLNNNRTIFILFSFCELLIMRKMLPEKGQVCPFCCGSDR